MSAKIRIKICGVSHPEDVKPLIDAGVDLVGLNFVPGSPREVDLATAEAISRSLEGQVERIAVFQDAEPEEIERVLRREHQIIPGAKNDFSLTDRKQFLNMQQEAAKIFSKSGTMLSNPSSRILPLSLSKASLNSFFNDNIIVSKVMLLNIISSNS